MAVRHHYGEKPLRYRWYRNCFTVYCNCFTIVRYDALFLNFEGGDHEAKEWRYSTTVEGEQPGQGIALANVQIELN